MDLKRIETQGDVDVKKYEVEMKYKFDLESLKVTSALKPVTITDVLFCLNYKYNGEGKSFTWKVLDLLRPKEDPMAIVHEVSNWYDKTQRSNRDFSARNGQRMPQKCRIVFCKTQGDNEHYDSAIKWIRQQMQQSGGGTTPVAESSSHSRVDELGP